MEIRRHPIMNYAYIESLILKCKSNDKHSKELLAEQFRPFILNLSAKTFIHGYDIHDIQHECYRILFHCVNLYNPERHRFVSYATNGIKNSINALIEKHKKRSSAEGKESLIFTDNYENYLVNEEKHIDEKLCLSCEYAVVKIAVAELEPLEKELVTFVFINNKTVREFSKLKHLTYNAAIAIKNMALHNLFLRLKYFYQI